MTGPSAGSNRSATEASAAGVLARIISFRGGRAKTPFDAVMTNLSDLISADAIDACMVASNKKALFQQLASNAAGITGMAARQIVACLNERERLGSTGFGGGIAIPHGKLEGLDRIVGYFARLSVPIDFHAIDNLPVDLVFLLLSPTDAGAEHLKALARVSRTLRDRQTVAKLRGARSKDAIFALLAGVETLNAA